MISFPPISRILAIFSERKLYNSNTALVDARGNIPQSKADVEALAAEHSATLVAINMIQSRGQMLAVIAENKGLLSKCNQVRIADIWQAYLDDSSRPDSGEGTLTFYQKAVTPFIKWLVRHHPECKVVNDISEDIAEDYASLLWKNGISERTYNARIGSLKLVFRILLKEQNLCDRIRHKTERQQSRNAFTPSQLQMIAQTLDSPSYYRMNKSEMRIMLLFMLYTGCRREDAAASCPVFGENRSQWNA